MAELEDAPWIKPRPGAPKVMELPDAPWSSADTKPAEPETGYAEDIAKSAGPSLLRGSLGALTTPRAISDATGAGVTYLAHKIGPQTGAMADKFHNWDTGMGQAFPSYEGLKGDFEHDFGPLYEAKTGPGKAFQTGTEILPGVLAGGEGVLPSIGRSIGAGALSGGIGSALDWAKSHIPSMPAWIPEAGRLAGAVVGGGVTPRAVTPLPMNNATLAERNALTATNPELRQASTAGQWTGSPRIQGLEARSGRAADVPQAQAEAYTRGVMGQAGAPGALFDTAGKQQAMSVGGDIDTLRNAHAINPAEMALLQRQNRQGYIDLSNTAGRAASQPYLNLQEDIRLGPNRGTPGFPTNRGNALHPTTIPGQRVGALAQEAQAAGTAATTPSLVGNRIFDMRDRLLNALYNSMPPDEAARLQGLNRSYSNWKTIEGIPTSAKGNTITPDQVFGKAPVGSQLETHANQAANVMTPLPKPNREVPPWFDLAHSYGTGLLQGAGAHASGAGLGPSAALAAEGIVQGHLLAPSVYNGAKDFAGRLLMRPTVQAYAKNQAWRPPGAAPNREALIRALIASGQPASGRIASPNQ